MDKFLVLSEELAEVIVTAKKTLNDHFATLELEYYESQDQKNLQGLLEDGIEAIDNAKSKGEIEKIVSDAILEMDDTPHFKVEYEAIIKDLEESLKAIIDESIAENSWLESQNLSLKMEVIIDAVKEINKYKVYKNSDDYIEDAKTELNAHISELNDLYEQIQKELQEWKDSPFRKPLVLRGARQTGKTTVINPGAVLEGKYAVVKAEKENKILAVLSVENGYFFENSRDCTLQF